VTASSPVVVNSLQGTCFYLDQIVVQLVDAGGRAQQLPVCLTELGSGARTAPVAAGSTAGTSPRWVTPACAPPESGRRYGITIAGGERGTALFAVREGRIIAEGARCP
jgi:hypothetical protein